MEKGREVIIRELKSENTQIGFELVKPKKKCQKGQQKSLSVCKVIDRTGFPLSPVYEKVNQKKKYVKFINEVNIFIINKTQNNNFAQDLQNFQNGY